MTQISQSNGLQQREGLRRRLADMVKWWAEHQAWPATDEIRIERPTPGRG